MAAALSGTALLAELEAEPALDVKADDLEYDLGLLAAFDGAAVDPAAYAAAREAALDVAAGANAQLLVRALFALPREVVAGVGTVAVLPRRNTRLPRELPPPAPKAPTKWEAFAKTKGIAKRTHRERMVFDADAAEGKGEYKPRHGYKRGRDAAGELVYELKPGDALTTDHLERRELEKKFKVTANQLNRVANAERALSGRDKRAGLAAPGADRGDGAVPLKRSKKKARLEGGGGGGGGGDDDEATGVRRAPAGIPSIPIAEGRADVFSGAGKQPRMKPSDSHATKIAQVRHAQVLTASMGKVSGGRARVRARGARSAAARGPRGASPPRVPSPLRQFDRESKGEPARRKDPAARARLPNEALPAERARDTRLLAQVLKGGLPADFAPVPSASLQGRGRSGIRTQAPKKKPKGVFGVARDGAKAAKIVAGKGAGKKGKTGKSSFGSGGGARKFAGKK